MPSVERWYVLSSVVRRYISFIVSGTSMNYLLLYHQWYGGIYLFHPFSGTLVCFILSGTALHLFHRQWSVDELSPFISSLVRWFFFFHAFSGTLVCVIVSGTAVHLFHRQWYVDELHLLISSVVRWYISLSCLQWNVGMCYRQWYVDKSFPSISSVVRWYISLISSLERWYLLLSVVRR